MPGFFYMFMPMLNGTAFDKLAWRIAYLYLVIPFIIFSLGWLKWFYGLPLALIVIVAAYFSIKQQKNFICIDVRKHRWIICICLVVLVLWVLFSGIGQFSYQNGDHYARNAVLKDLVEQPWPLVYDFTHWQPYGVTEPGKYMLVYYIGYWMPAAVVGKIFGLGPAHFFLFLWTILGVTLVFYFICRYFKKIRFWLLVLFILFSGMDVIAFILKGEYGPFSHLEWWHNARQQYTSNTSLLYWVFNQAIAPWLIISMFFNHLPKQNIAFVCALCFFYAPFPFLGLIPIAAYFFFSQGKPLWKETFSFQNTVAAALIFLLMIGYYSAISTESSFNLFIRPFSENFIFYISEFLLIALIVLFCTRKKILVLVATVSLIVLSYIQYRHTPDLMMRASIPALFVLMILAAEQLMMQKRRIVKFALLLLLITGSVTALNEITRSVYFSGRYWYEKEVKNQAPGFVLLQKPDLFRGKNPVIAAMIGNSESGFCKIFLKQVK